jgi:pyruvate dehydrogenase E2 component (dihydrolipoamide acetyltransferase)
LAQFYEMPAISPTMEIGTLVTWRVKEGEAFKSGTVLAEIGTDKANMEAEIFDPGVMLKHLIAEGDEVPPGYPIAIWGQQGEDIAGLLTEFESRKKSLAAKSGGTVSADKAEPALEKPVAVTAAVTPGAPPRPQPPGPQSPSPQSPGPQAVQASTGKVAREWMGKPIQVLFADPPGDVRFGGAAPSDNGSNGRVSASPLARKLAAEKGLDLKGLQGTGPGGRIVVKDVEQAKAPAQGPAPGQPSPGQPSPGQPSQGRADEVVRNTPMRKTIARRLTESHQQIPTFFLTASLDGRGFVELREDLKKKLPDVKISYNDMLIMAVARALREHPQVNASWADKEIVRHGRVDIGIAVAMPDGLITPVLRRADSLPLTQIAERVRELANRARAQKLQPDEYTGGTFTISNLGMFGIEHFTAIINPPESAILAVGALEEVAVVSDGALVPGWRMKVTMTCDHRVVDGAVGAAFLQTLRKYVESPWLLLV